MNFLKFLAEILANLVLYAFAFHFLITIKSFFWSCAVFSMFATAAFLVSEFLDGNPDMDKRAVVTGVLILLTGNIAHAFVAPIFTMLLWFFVVALYESLKRLCP